MQVLGMTPAIMRAIAPQRPPSTPPFGLGECHVVRRAVRCALPKSEFAGANQPSPDPEGPALARGQSPADDLKCGHFIREAVLQRSTVPTQPFTVLELAPAAGRGEH